MKAADFSYQCPETLEAALAILNDAGGEAVPLAGGQSLMPMMNFRMAQPDVLVDLNRLDELKGITKEGDRILIGAMTRYTELAESDLIAAHVPLFRLAIPHIAHSAVRNRGTIGGSVSLADPAAEMPALLLALEAEIITQGKSGSRRIPAEEFFLGLYETALNSGELVTGVSVPVAADHDRCSFYELARRHGDYAMAGVAIMANGEHELSKPRIAFFAISDRALRARSAEHALEGNAADDPAAFWAAIHSLAEISFSGDLNASQMTKRYLAGIVLKRALMEL